MKPDNEPMLTEAKSILIVDDDPDTCQLLDMLFRRKGYTTTLAYSGQQALHLVETSQPDAVILDVMMPGMDGWETYQGLRDFSSVPVLFLTALTSGEAASKALRLGADDYVRKPFYPDELLVRTQALLEKPVAKEIKRISTKTQRGILTPPAVAVVIPAYNESRFIGSTVLKARQYAQCVVVVDDGSTDGTAGLAEAAEACVVRHERNQGKGAALNTGMRAARELGARVVVTLDADGQHNPEEMNRLLAPVIDGQADIVVGSRYMDHISHIPRHRAWGHRAFNLLTQAASGVKVSDSQSGFRAFSARALEAISFHSNGFSVESEMQFLAHELGLRVAEVPVTIQYTDRPKRSVVMHGLIVLNGVLRLVGQHRPLMYFGVPGVVILLVGVGWGVYVVEIFRNTSQLAVGYALISVLLSMLGMLMLSTGIVLHSVRGLLTDLLKSK